MIYNVLFVDDEIDRLEHYKVYFEHNELINCYFSLSSEDAFELAHTLTVHLLVINNALPGLKGLDLVHILGVERFAAGVILLTSRESRLELLSEGMIVLNKSIEMPLLKSFVLQRIQSLEQR